MRPLKRIPTFWTSIHIAGGQVSLGAALPIGQPEKPAELPPPFIVAADPAVGLSTDEMFAATGGVP